MVTMRMGQDDGLDRQSGDLAKLSKNVGGCRSRFSCVDNDQTIIADDHIDIRSSKAEGLVDIVSQLDNFLFEIRRMGFQFGMHNGLS